jgi:catechol 2,3-dioxygenase-like lactoylglutathione lyase family enzyme
VEWRPLVPELVVSNFETSLHFYATVLGFAIRYRRTKPPFVYLEFEGAQIMLEELQDDSWLLGSLQKPFGRGMNLQIECSDVVAVRAKVAAAHVDVYRELEDAWYQADDATVGQKQFIVPDPDGYLLRFCQDLDDYRNDA